MSSRAALCFLVAVAATAQAAERLAVAPAGRATWAALVAADARAPRTSGRPTVVPRPPAPAPRSIDGGAAPAPRGASPPAPDAASPLAPAPRGAGPLAPAPSASFAALDDVNTSIPPDTMGAVGPSHLVTMLNTQVRIQTKAGAALGTVSLATFWTGGTGLSGTPFDPHVVYDAGSGRWIATAGANGNAGSAKVFLAVSADSDPTGMWHFWSFDADGTHKTWADFDAVGANATWIAITANMFTVSASPTFAGAKMWVVDKATALAGGTLTTTVFAPGFDVAGGRDGFGLQPALTLDADPTLWIVDLGGWTTPLGVPLLRLSRITGTGAAPTWSAAPGSSSVAGSGLFAVPTSFALDVPPDAAQLGTATPLDGGDYRVSPAMARNGMVWVAHEGGLPVGGVDRTAAFWYQLDPTAMPSPVVQSGVLDGGAGVFHLYPSIAAGADGSACIGFTRTSASRHPEAAAATRAGTDAAGTMSAVGTVKAGEDVYEKDFGSGSVRWGDYSATSIDPADDVSCWTIQEYAAAAVGPTTDDDRWGTWWARFTPAGATTTTTSTTSISVTTTSSSTTSTTDVTSSTTTTPPPTSSTTTNSTPTTTTTTLPVGCGGAPRTDCRLARASSLRVRAGRPGKPLLRWTWAHGSATTLADYGDPVHGSPAVHACLYDASGAPQPRRALVVPARGTCGRRRCWVRVPGVGYAYRRAGGAPDGVVRLVLTPGANGRARVRLAAARARLAPPPLPLALPVTMQLVVDDPAGSRCWQATFTRASRSDARGLAAKAP